MAPSLSQQVHGKIAQSDTVPQFLNLIPAKLSYGLLSYVLLRLHRRAWRRKTIKPSKRTSFPNSDELAWINVTAHPTPEWIAQQISEASSSRGSKARLSASPYFCEDLRIRHEHGAG